MPSQHSALPQTRRQTRRLSFIRGLSGCTQGPWEGGEGWEEREIPTTRGYEKARGSGGHQEASTWGLPESFPLPRVLSLVALARTKELTAPEAQRKPLRLATHPPCD